MVTLMPCGTLCRSSPTVSDCVWHHLSSPILPAREADVRAPGVMLGLNSSCNEIAPLTTDVENNIAEVSMDVPLLSKVLVIQRAWRDFQSRQDILEKRSPSPPSLTSSSDKMSTSISMATLSDGSTPLPHMNSSQAVMQTPHSH
ncbi:hypothetical protein ACEWY4_008090 [Coilia grayii]|uniref:Fusion protein IQCJ-SCHIP1 N-terminal domain-containing protein n=1 Tax=Coilia grayii TaxID=363190 RepID=A0ABD1KA22_9TELE